MEVERGADADEHGRIEPRAHARHPLLLLGRADPYPYDVGPRSVYILSDPGVVGGVELAEGRRVAADDPQPRERLAQVQRELGERALIASAVEVEAGTAAGGSLGRVPHQVGPVDAVGQPVAEQV